MDTNALTELMKETAGVILDSMASRIESIGTSPIKVNHREYAVRMLAIAIIEVHRKIANAEARFVSDVIRSN